MQIKINGQNHDITGSALLDLLAQKNLNPEKIVVEHNSNIIEKHALSGITLKEGDVLEIVSFVGGG